MFLLLLLLVWSSSALTFLQKHLNLGTIPLDVVLFAPKYARTMMELEISSWVHRSIASTRPHHGQHPRVPL